MIRHPHIFWLEKIAYDAVQAAIRASQNSVPTAVPKSVREERKLQGMSGTPAGSGIVNRTANLANKTGGVSTPTPTGVGAVTRQARYGSKANVPGVTTKQQREQAKLNSMSGAQQPVAAQAPVPSREAREQAKLSAMGHSTAGASVAPSISGLGVKRRSVVSVNPPKPSSRPLTP